MRAIILSFALLFNFMAFSMTSGSTKGAEKKSSYDDALEFVQANYDLDQTCLDDYIKREKKLKKILIWAPPLTLVGAPASFYIGGTIAGYLSVWAGAEGWSAIGYAVLGAYGAFLSSVGIFTFVETTRGFEFAGNRFIMNVVSSLLQNDRDSKPVKKFLKKYRRKYKNDTNISDDDILDKVLELDQTGLLCSGKLRKNEGKSLRKRLARRTHIQKYIHRNL